MAEGNGMGVDIRGNPVIDPTKNVLDLVNASITRINDLNTIRDRRIDDLEKAEQNRVDAALAAEVHRIDEVAQLREKYQLLLANAESHRLDAIRAVDVAAVQVANEKANAQAAVLAAQVQTTADTMRALVSSASDTAAKQVQQVTSQFSERIAALEKAINIGSGKETVADPMIAQMVNEIKALRDYMALGTGKSSGISTAWAVLIGAVGLIGAIIAIVLSVVK